MKFTGLSDSDKGAANMFDHPESGDFDMTNELRSGLIAISIFAYLSFFVSTTLFIYLLYKMISWRMRQSSRADRVVRNMPGPPVGEEFTVEDRAFGPQGQDSKAAHEDNITRVEQSKKRQPNQFLVLVHNLLLADMHQATSFLLSTTWLQKGGIYIEERSCWVQGFFDSNGDLASSCFITAIAIHTYLSLVKNWRPPQWGIYLGAALIWLFVYSMSVLPLLITRNGRTVGGYYVRAGAWVSESDHHVGFHVLTPPSAGSTRHTKTSAYSPIISSSSSPSSPRRSSTSQSSSLCVTEAALPPPSPESRRPKSC